MQANHDHLPKELFNVQFPKDVSREAVSVKDLMGLVDRFSAEHQLEARFHENWYDLNPRKQLWLDMYPPLSQLSTGDRNQMLDDWRSQEWNKVMYLYVHFPFCAKRCEFCYYHITTQMNEIESYLTRLEREMRAFLSHMNQGSSAPDLFFGGGTPSVVPVRLLRYTFDLIYEYIDRDRIGTSNLELHPSTMRKDLHQLAESGHIDRASMGVQTFSREVLEQNNRIWTSVDQVREICQQFRNAGIKRIGLDFIVGLYQQNLSHVEEDVAHLKSLIKDGLIDSVSVYPRSFTDNSLPFEREVIDMDVLLEKCRAHMLFRWFFVSEGWKEGPMYLFTPPNFVQVPPSATVNEPATAQVIGFGNSARSTFNQTNYMNVKPYQEYMEANGSLGATGHFERLNEDQVQRRFLQFSAKRGFIDLSCFPIPLAEEDREQLDQINEELEADGLVVRHGDKIYVTPLGALFVEWIHRKYEQTFREAVVA